MLRSLAFPKASLFLLFYLAVGWGAAPARADTTYILTAHATEAGYNDFSLQYTDDDYDGKFRLNELDEWAGYDKPAGGTHYGYIWYVPGQDKEGQPLELLFGGIDQSRTYWGFAAAPLGTGNVGVVVSVEKWTYSQTPVPLPPSALLLASGLIPLAWARRKKRLEK